MGIASTPISTGRVLALVAGSLLLVASGCGDGDESVQVSGAWARTTPENAVNGAAYLSLTVEQHDRLVSVSVDPSVAAGVEIHEIVEVDDDAGHDHDDDDRDHGDDDGHEHGDDDHEMGDDETGSNDEGNPMLAMRELTQGLELEEGETAVFEPGGLHFMLLDLAEPLEAGDSFEIELQFESSEPLSVTVPVQDDAP